MGMNGNRDQASTDDPPHSRLFIIYNRNDPMSESEFQAEFSQFGEVQDIFLVKDKKTGEPKGVGYVKYSKMSDAAMAMETLNNTPIKNHNGTYKICIAKNRGETKDSDSNDPDRFSRLFVTMPRTLTEAQLNEYFKKFGSVKSIKLLRFKDTNESKGIGYVTYNKVSDAAKAVEAPDNEHGFKAVIARPKDKSEPIPVPKKVPQVPNNYVEDSQWSTDSFYASVSPLLSKDQVHRIFDIAPGLIDIKTLSQNTYRTEILATYKSIVASEYAISKLHGIEYPLGDFIKIDSKQSHTKNEPAFSANKRFRSDLSTFTSAPVERHTEEDDKIRDLTKALNDATELLKSRGLGGCSSGVATTEFWSRSNHCSFPLPGLQQVHPKSDFNEATGMRLFFVGQPAAPPVEALYDVFCRFDNFAGVSIGQKKNYGYLYYTDPESAMRAIETMDDKIVAGMTLKVLKADPKGEVSNKRKRPSN